MIPIIITFIVMFSAWPSLAADAQIQSEIDHLMRFIHRSNCAFIRNGKAYSADEALEHIQKKYDHFKYRIQSTEDFIDYCASKSILTDQAYKIDCPDQDVVESKLWLLQELKRFRNN